MGMRTMTLRLCRHHRSRRNAEKVGHSIKGSQIVLDEVCLMLCELSFWFMCFIVGLVGEARHF